MPTGQTARQTDGRTPDRYITLTARRGQRKNTLPISKSSFVLFVQWRGSSVARDGPPAQTA